MRVTIQVTVTDVDADGVVTQRSGAELVDSEQPGMGSKAKVKDRARRHATRLIDELTAAPPKT